MTNHRMRDELDTALGGLTFSPSMQERVRARCGAEPPPRRGPLRLTRRAAVVLAVCAALAATALAVGPTVWELLQAQLGNFMPYVTPVLASSEDQGITVSAVAAMSDGNVTKILVTLQDLTGDRLDAETRLDADWAQYGAVSSKAADYRVFQPELLSYDGGSNTAVFMVRLDGVDTDTPVRIAFNQITPGYREDGLRLSYQDMSDAVLETAETPDGHTVLLPAQNPQTLAEGGEISVSSMGFDGEGRYHIRFLVAEQVKPSLIYGFQSCLVDFNIPQRDFSAEVVPVEDGFDVCFPDSIRDIIHSAESGHLFVDFNYSVGGGPVEGSWPLDVTIQPVEGLALDWSGAVTLPIIREDGSSPVAYVDKVTLSPLTVVIDYHTFESSQPISDIPVTLRDGTQVIAQRGYSTGNRAWLPGGGETGWDVWEFSEPIDVDSVASITIEGQTIPVP